jgi:hypothetical protein
LNFASPLSGVSSGIAPKRLADFGTRTFQRQPKWCFAIVEMGQNGFSDYAKQHKLFFLTFKLQSITFDVLPGGMAALPGALAIFLPGMTQRPLYHPQVFPPEFF